jgi:hypothetical protein
MSGLLDGETTRKRCWRALGFALALVVANAPAVARAETRVAVVGLAFKGQVSTAIQAAMAKRLDDGLVAAGLRVIPEAELRRVLGGRQGRCVEVACWKELFAKLGCRYIVGGSVTRDENNYDIALWMGDAATGTLGPSVSGRCDICGLVPASERMELTASELAAKLAAMDRAPARVTVLSDPPGATVLVDGKEVGPAPRELELAAGEHKLIVHATGYLAATRNLTVVSSMQERVEIRLLPEAGGSSGARAAGWTVGAAGVAALVAGIALFAINGQAADCPADVGAKACHRDTRIGGGVLVGVGVAALGVGGYLLYRGYRKGAGGAVGAERAAARAPLSWSF